MKHTNQERKVYPMKFTKFIPLALALTLAVPSFAATATSQGDILQFTLSPFFNITKNAGKNDTGTVSPNETYTVLNVTDEITFGYHVVTNNRSDAVKLTVTALSSAGQKDALGGTVDAPVIAFTNISAPTKPTAEQIYAAAGKSAVKSATPNVIAFNVTPTVKMVDDTGAAADPAGTMTSPGAEGANIKYTFNNGEYNFDYVLPSVVQATFSTYDTEGTYVANVLMTQVEP